MSDFLDLSAINLGDEETLFSDLKITWDPASLLVRELQENYSICPFCGLEVNLSGVSFENSGEYPFCDCFQNSLEWQTRMQTFPVDQFVEPSAVVRQSYVAGKHGSVIKLVLRAEDLEIKPGHRRKLWRLYLLVDPRLLQEGEKLETIHCSFWPPIETQVRLILELRYLLFRLGNFPRGLDEVTVRELEQRASNLADYLDSLW